MATRGQDLGAAGETAAAEALSRAGYEILERNLRTPFGEIDILARHQGLLCLVEVKSRSDDRFGSPAEAVTPAKRSRLRRMATFLLMRPEWREASVRFDVVAVLKAPGGGLAVEILPDAFS